ncbi:MAG: hypothetical protein IKQ44_00760 [Lachnospiraceae bacterium]|nr:hypothetical protein [Lachnospiraceae bacterium]
MSYSIKYSPFSAYFDRGYIYDWPHALSDEGKELIKKILRDNNALALNLSQLEVSEDMSDNRYFIILPEGALLFRLGEHQGEKYNDTAIIGIFIEKEYVSTAWLMINKLMSYIYSEYLYQNDEEQCVVYEDILDEIHSSITFDDIPIDLEYDEKPYSFAISAIDPKIPNVRHYPLQITTELINRVTNLADDRSLEPVFNSKKITQVDEESNLYKGVYIERYIDSNNHGFLKERLFINWGGAHSSWVVSRAGDAMTSELECILEGKVTKFSKLKSEINANLRGKGTFMERR